VGFAPRLLEFDQTATMIDAVRRGAGWGIATPFCLLGAELKPEEIDVRLLPPPSPHRTLNLITKRGRFGRMPSELADRCRNHLVTSILTKLAPLTPVELMPKVF